MENKCDIKNNSDEKEIIVFLRYLISHNESHVKDFLDLANKLKDKNDIAYKSVLEAIEKYNEGNSLLKKAQESLTK